MSRTSPYKNREFLYNVYWNNNLSIGEINEKYGISSRSIQDWFKLFNIPMRTISKGLSIRLAKNHNIQQYIEAYKNGLSLREISKIYPVDRNTLKNHLINNGIRIKTNGEQLTGRKIPRDIVEKIRLKTTGRRKENPISTKNELFRKRDNYKEWRKEVFERDNYICQHCGKEGNILNAHHIYEFSKHKDKRLIVSNGVTLCKKCHFNLHRGKINPIIQLRLI